MREDSDCLAISRVEGILRKAGFTAALKPCLRRDRLSSLDVW